VLNRLTGLDEEELTQALFELVPAQRCVRAYAGPLGLVLSGLGGHSGSSHWLLLGFVERGKVEIVDADLGGHQLMQEGAEERFR
jgi:hypothetical protein